MSMHIENNITSWSPSYMVPSRHKGRIGYSPQGCEEKDSSLLQRKLKVSDVEAIIELIQNFKCLMLMKAKKCEKCPLQFMQLCVQHNKCISFTSVSSCQLQQLPSISLSKFISSWAREVQTIPLALPCGSIYPSTNLSGSETLISNACKSTVPSGGLVLKTPGAHYTNMLVATCTKLHNGSIYNVLSRQGIAKWPTHTHTLAKVHPEIIVLWLTPLFALLGQCLRKKIANLADLKIPSQALQGSMVPEACSAKPNVPMSKLVFYVEYTKSKILNPLYSWQLTKNVMSDCIMMQWFLPTDTIEITNQKCKNH